VAGGVLAARSLRRIPIALIGTGQLPTIANFDHLYQMDPDLSIGKC
jgi:hypothetical protein